MALTSAQNATLKAAILADNTLNTFPLNSDGAFAIAAALNIVASPDFWVWKTKVPQIDIVSITTEDGTTWSWTAYIARSQGERDGWREMFADTGAINASLANTRQGLQDIFSGSANSAPAQRTHLLAIARRRATKAEKILASGTGSTASPAVMGFEGMLSYSDVEAARNS